jgi:hypothetical protein
MLHITNGASVVGTLQQSSLPGDPLSWSDVLHDGPVPQTATLEELSDVRAAALAGFGWGEAAGIRAEFAARDAALRAFRNHEEVVLWFEHDLFDQLQLLQLLDWFSREDAGATRLTLVQVSSFPGVEPFYGLGQLHADQLAQLFPARVPVTDEQKSLAAQAWKAFRAAEPTGLNPWMTQSHAGLPFLANALRRLGEEFPWTSDGLSRTERQLLRAAADGAHTKQELYHRSSSEEEVPWGDASVFLRIDGLTTGAAPALAKNGGRDLRLTEEGSKLLAGQADWIRLHGGMDSWIGGTHLNGAAPKWRWNPGLAQIIAA